MVKNILSEVMKREQKKMVETHKKLLKQEKQRFIPMQLHLQERDIITSKKGILLKSAIGTEKFYLVKKIKIMGNGYSEVMGNKTEIDVKPIKKNGSI